jgi:hypothetical protein
MMNDSLRIDSYNARLISTFGPTKVNEFRFQWSRDFEYEIGDQPPPETYANGSGNFSFGLATFLQRHALADERRTRSSRITFLTSRAGTRSNSAARSITSTTSSTTRPSSAAPMPYPNVLALWRDLVNPGAKNYSSFLQDFGLAE